MFFGSRCIRVCEKSQVSERFVFAEFDWKYHIFLNINTEEWELKTLLFNYWNDIFLGSVETYFLEVGAYVFVKRTTASVWEVRFYWIWLEISHFFKYKNGGVWPKNFIIWLLKWYFLRLSRNVFSNICLLVFEVFQVFHLLHLRLLAAGHQRLTLL